MKKLFLVLALLVGISAIVVPTVYATQSAYASPTLPDDARPITVFRVKQVGANAWSNSPVSAYYSASENCIYVNEGSRKNQPYSVYENRAYGQSNDGRAGYRYVAGGEYYFNL